MDEANLRKNWSSNFCFKWQSDIREYNSSVLTLNHRRSDWLFVESRALRQNNLLSDNFGKLEIGRFSSLSLLHQILTQCSNITLHYTFTRSQFWFRFNHKYTFAVLSYSYMQKNHEYLFWSIAILNKNHGMELFFFLKKNVYFRPNLLWCSSSDCHLKISI